MKKDIIILFIALLGISFTATSALAGSSRGHGYNDTSITVAGYGPAGYVQIHSAFSVPSLFFPFPQPFFHGTVVNSRCGSRYGHHGHHRVHHNKSYRHGNDRHRDDRGKGKKHRSDGRGKRL